MTVMLALLLHHQASDPPMCPNHLHDDEVRWNSGRSMVILVVKQDDTNAKCRLHMPCPRHWQQWWCVEGQRIADHDVIMFADISACPSNHNACTNTSSSKSSKSTQQMAMFFCQPKWQQATNDIAKNWGFGMRILRMSIGLATTLCRQRWWQGSCGWQNGGRVSDILASSSKCCLWCSIVVTLNKQKSTLPQDVCLALLDTALEDASHDGEQLQAMAWWLSMTSVGMWPNAWRRMKKFWTRTEESASHKK